MKKDVKKVNVLLSSAQKKKAITHTFSDMISSFKTEGVHFSAEQQKKLRAKLQLTK